MGTFSFRPKREKLWVVAMVWVRLNLNPHPFKTKRVRHPTAGVMEKNKLAMGFARSFLRDKNSTRDGAAIVRTRIRRAQIVDGAWVIFLKINFENWFEWVMRRVNKSRGRVEIAHGRPEGTPLHPVAEGKPFDRPVSMRPTASTAFSASSRNPTNTSRLAFRAEFGSRPPLP